MSCLYQGAYNLKEKIERQKEGKEGGKEQGSEEELKENLHIYGERKSESIRSALKKMVDVAKDRVVQTGL